MEDHELRVLRGQESPSPALPPVDLLVTAIKFFRLIGAGLGLACIVTGLVFGVQVFMMARDLIMDPTRMDGHFEVWAGDQAAAAPVSASAPIAEAAPAPVIAIGEGATTATLTLRSPDSTEPPLPNDPAERAVEIFRRLASSLGQGQWGRPAAALFVLLFLGFGAKVSFGLISAGGALVGSNNKSGPNA